MSISGFMGIMNLGLGEATLRYVAYYYGRNDLAGINRVVGATFSVYILMGFLGWALLYFGAPWVINLIAVPQPEQALGVGLLRLTSINFGMSFISGAFSTIPQALQRYDISSKVSVAQSVFQISGTIVILLKGLGIYELVLWSVVTSLFTQIIHLFVARRLIPKIRLRPSPAKDGLKEVFGYGIFSLITNILGIVWGQADRLLLGALVNPAAVAYLSVPQQISFRGSTAVGSAGAVLFPKFSSMEDRNQIQRLYLDATWIMLCATIVIFVPLTVLFPDFLRLWISPEFAKKSAWIGQVIAFSCIVRGAFVPYMELFKGLGKPQYLSILFFATGMTSLFVNLLLIPKFGLAGAGYCYLATVFWGFASIVFTWKHLLGMASLRPLLHATVIPIGLGLIVLVFAAIIRANIQEPGWIGFITLSMFFMGCTAIILVGVNWVIGRGSSHAYALFGAIKKFYSVLRPAILSQIREKA
jgi:O-antigen/teichoic acid export membrane protein